MSDNEIEGDIFNADENLLFYKTLSNTTFSHQKQEMWTRQNPKRLSDTTIPVQYGGNRKEYFLHRTF